MFKEFKKSVSVLTLAAVAIMAVSQGQAMENYRPAGIENHPDLLAQFEGVQDSGDLVVDYMAKNEVIFAYLEKKRNNLVTVHDFTTPLMRSDRNMALRIMRAAKNNRHAVIANIITQSANEPILANRVNLITNYLNQHGL